MFYVNSAHVNCIKYKWLVNSLFPLYNITLLIINDLGLLCWLTLPSLQLCYTHLGNELDNGKEECRNDDDSSSDDELFKPASFLRNIKFEPDVKTPAKSTTPISGKSRVSIYLFARLCWYFRSKLISWFVTTSLQHIKRGNQRLVVNNAVKVPVFGWTDPSTWEIRESLEKCIKHEQKTSVLLRFLNLINIPKCLNQAI